MNNRKTIRKTKRKVRRTQKLKFFGIFKKIKNAIRGGESEEVYLG